MTHDELKGRGLCVAPLAWGKDHMSFVDAAEEYWLIPEKPHAKNKVYDAMFTYPLWGEYETGEEVLARKVSLDEAKAACAIHNESRVAAKIGVI